jgi:transposase InsO family protein
MSDSLHATVALAALRLAASSRNPPFGLVHHSDRGVQYACRECRDLLEEHGMAQSMSRSGDCYDNAKMESVWAPPKKERVHGRRCRTQQEATANGLRMDRDLIPANEDSRRTRLRQSRSIRGGREGRDGCLRVLWKSTPFPILYLMTLGVEEGPLTYGPERGRHAENYKHLQRPHERTECGHVQQLSNSFRDAIGERETKLVNQIEAVRDAG